MSRTDHLILAGYVVVTPTVRPPGLEPLLPDPYMTVSPCLADDLTVPEFSGWFQDLAEAETALDRSPTAELLAIGLTLSDAVALATEVDGEDHHFELLRQEHDMPPDARLLGFEVLGAEYSLTFHSWHCHGLASDAATALGIRLNIYGLLHDHADASRVLDWMNSLPDNDAPAPVPWTAAAIARMDRRSSH